jgi:hypothetical protein
LANPTPRGLNEGRWRVGEKGEVRSTGGDLFAASHAGGYLWTNLQSTHARRDGVPR